MKSPDDTVFYKNISAQVVADRDRFFIQFQPILESISDAIALADPHGRVIYHNAASLALHGYADLEEALLIHDEGEPQWDIRDLSGRPVPKDQWPMPRVLRGESYNGEVFRVRRRDTGKAYVGSYNGKMIRDAHGVAMFAMLTIRDITHQQNAEEALRSSENRYRSLFSSMTEGFALHEVITDAEGRPRDYRFLEINPAFEKLTGLNHNDLVGRCVLDVMPGTESYWIESYGRVALTGEPAQFESYSAELERWYEVFAYQTAPMQFATIFKDITARKQAEERARQEHRETAFANRVLRAFMEYDGDALFDQALSVVQEEMASKHGVFGYIAQPGHLICPSLSKMLDACEIEGKCIHYPPEKWKGLWARALKEKRSLYTNETVPVPPRHPPINNNLAAPILFNGEVIGLLNIANKDGGYTDADRDTLDRIAARFAPVLYAWIQRKLREDEGKAAAAEVQQLAQQRQLALDAAKLGWWQYDPVTRVAQWDDAYKEIFGISGDTQPNEEFLQQVIHHKDLPAQLAKVEEALNPADPQPYMAEFRIHRPDGQVRWVEAHGVATFEGTGANRRAVNFVGTVQDITERKESEAAVLESEARLSAILNQLPVGVSVIDSSGRGILQNDIMRKYMPGMMPSCDPEQQKRWHAVDSSGAMIPPEQWPAVRALAGESVMPGIEVNYTDGSGHIFCLMVSAVPFTNLNGGRIGAIMVVQDITKIKEAECALRDINEELNEYTYAVVHNVKAPFRAVQNYANFLLEDLGGTLKGEPRQFLDGIKSAINQANHQFDDLDALYQIRKYEPEFETTDMRAMLDEIAAVHRTASDRQLIICEQWPVARCEQFLLRQILAELINNGYKYNRSDIKTVEVGWRPAADGWLEILVRDNGIGIEAQYHEHIFHIFKRLHTEEDYEGTGIGLAIVRRAVKKIGGDLRIESAVGEGSTFVISLPAARVESAVPFYPFI